MKTLHSPDMGPTFTEILAVLHERGFSPDSVPVIRYPEGQANIDAAYEEAVARLKARLDAAREEYWKSQEDYSGSPLSPKGCDMASHREDVPTGDSVECGPVLHQPGEFNGTIVNDWETMPFNSTNPRPIGNISNYYGGLCVYEARGEYYWVITDDSGHYPARQQIPKSLYDELIRFDDSLKDRDHEQTD